MYTGPYIFLTLIIQPYVSALSDSSVFQPPKYNVLLSGKTHPGQVPIKPDPTAGPEDGLNPNKTTKVPTIMSITA